MVCPIHVFFFFYVFRSLMFSCISEPFFFFFAPRMIKTLGVDMMLQITMATYAVRCVG